MTKHHTQKRDAINLALSKASRDRDEDRPSASFADLALARVSIAHPVSLPTMAPSFDNLSEQDLHELEEEEEIDFSGLFSWRNFVNFYPSLADAPSPPGNRSESTI